MAEMLDLYDAQRMPTGEIIVRGSTIPENRYALGVVVWVRNPDGRFLMSQRHPKKTHPLIWEPTGGAVQSGEDTRSAAVRELEEELGIKVKAEELTLICTRRRSFEFQDVYLAQWDGAIDALRLQEDEVMDARWVNGEELMRLETIPFTKECFHRFFCEEKDD